MHIGVSALVRSWWLNGRATTILFERAAATIQHWQRRNAAARRGNTKKTRQKLRRLGIKLTKIIQCKWP